MSETIAQDVVATFHYTLRNGRGEVLDSSRTGEPLSYLHGFQNIVPGLERALEGKRVGDRLEVVVEPADGYGERDAAGARKAPRHVFPDGLAPGMQLFAQDAAGNVIPIWITTVGDDVVEFDTNHPLAGAQLHFDVEIIELRAGNAEELVHGHPHGRHGDQGHGHHHHGGCQGDGSCGGGGCGAHDHGDDEGGCGGGGCGHCHDDEDGGHHHHSH